MTATTIANLALARLGNTTISDITEDSETARACQVLYNQTRRELLRSHRWNFAQKRAALSELADEPAFGWEHQFGIPSDCLRILEVGESEHGDNLSERFVVEGNAILTDQDSVNLVYVYDCENPELFDPLFVEALSLRMAVKLCNSLQGTSGNADRLNAEYDQRIAPLARRIDANEGRRRKGLIDRSSPLVQARTSGLLTGINDFPDP